KTKQCISHHHTLNGDNECLCVSVLFIDKKKGHKNIDSSRVGKSRTAFLPSWAFHNQQYMAFQASEHRPWSNSSSSIASPSNVNTTQESE
ncbi:unnamed protein product, partial [Trichogramma brassicae]